MTAVARYALADYLRSQRFVPPLVAYLGCLAVLHAGGGDALAGYGMSAAALVPVTVWLTLTLHNAEDPVQTAVTVVNAGGRYRVVAGRTGAVLVCALALTAASLAAPVLAERHLPPAADLACGLLAHLTCAFVAAGLGACCARPVIRRQGYAFTTALLLSLVVLVARPVTPANQTIRLIAGAPPRPPAVDLLLLTGGAAVMLAALVALASWLSARRA
ncbi:hypothetical protein [Streptomyces sp. RFCAC02]|uniref:hypothetical protein n=1 Tax=Streptomyces sp. RFCAC02 TaxID=2499143 RepID=UPI00102269FF|nr:hypothetical protein [Streptomyces sp. RFCAC02]